MLTKVVDTLPAESADVQPAVVGKPSSKIRLSEEAQAKNKQIMLTRGVELMFISPLIHGYAMKNKLWSKSRAPYSSGGRKIVAW